MAQRHRAPDRQPLREPLRRRRVLSDAAAARRAPSQHRACATETGDAPSITKVVVDGRVEHTTEAVVAPPRCARGVASGGEQDRPDASGTTAPVQRGQTPDGATSACSSVAGAWGEAPLETLSSRRPKA